jgi:hypothetical protein
MPKSFHFCNRNANHDFVSLNAPCITKSLCAAIHAKNSRLLLTAKAKISRTDSVSSQPMHASVMLTPYFKPALPSLGTFWLPDAMLDHILPCLYAIGDVPSLILLSIITPIMEFSPLAIWLATSAATLG